MHVLVCFSDEHHLSSVTVFSGNDASVVCTPAQLVVTSESNELDAPHALPSIVVTSVSANATAAAAKVMPEPDGATAHCVWVNVMAFNHGKIAVLPALEFASEGLGATPAQELSHMSAHQCWRSMGCPISVAMDGARTLSAASAGV